MRFSTPCTNSIGPHLDLKPDYWVEVEARYSGVRGLLVTQAVIDRKPAEGIWVLTHRASGRTTGHYYPTIAAAKRAAKRVALLFDWTLDAPQAVEAARSLTKEQKRALRDALMIECI